jgi:DNA-binding transcriptional ArsR family regulator
MPILLTGALVTRNLPFVATYQDGLAALGDTTRRSIFELLGEGPSSVGELARRLPVSRPAVSQHLRVLKEVGLVVDRPVGTLRVYQLDPAGVATIRAYLDRFWGKALDEFKAVAEAPDTTWKDEIDDRTSRADRAQDGDGGGSPGSSV